MEKEYKLNQSPFDLYDIFGYFAPGLVFTISLSIFLGYLPNQSLSGYLIHLKTLLKWVTINKVWWLDTLFFISSIAIIYIIGHLISSISSLLIEKYILKKASGYPYEKLFRLKPSSRLHQFSRGYYKFMIVIVNLYLLRLLFAKFPGKLEWVFFGCFFFILPLAKAIISNLSHKNKMGAKTMKIINDHGHRPWS